MPTQTGTLWNFTSRSVCTVKKNKEQLIDVFNYTINSEDFKNDLHPLIESLQNCRNDNQYFSKSF